MARGGEICSSIWSGLRGYWRDYRAPNFLRDDRRKHEERALFGDGCVGGFGYGTDARCDYAAADKDGVVAEHRDEHDDGAAASAGGGGEDAGDGQAGAGSSAEDDRNAVVHDAGQMAEVVYRHAAEAKLPALECAPERDGDVERYGVHVGRTGSSKGHMEATFVSQEKINGKVHMEMTSARQSQPIVMDVTFESVYQGADCKGISPDSPKIVR